MAGAAERQFNAKFLRSRREGARETDCGKYPEVNRGRMEGRAKKLGLPA